MSNSHTFIDNKSAVAALFQQALASAFPTLSADDFKIEIEKPKNPDHGHFAVNSALQLAKKLGKKPREIADALVAALAPSDLLLNAPEIAGPGFINIRLSLSAETRVINNIFASADTFGRSTEGAHKKVMVEFVSANPTGPLHVGRGCSIGRAGMFRVSFTITTPVRRLIIWHCRCRHVCAKKRALILYFPKAVITAITFAKLRIAIPKNFRTI
jgi:Arginyl tRNA synthetase N terminal domain